MAEPSTPLTPKKIPRLDSSMSGHPIFGNLEETLPTRRFPSMLNVVNHVRYLKAHRLAGGGINGMYHSVTDHLMDVWKSAYVVPLLERNTIFSAVKKYTEEKLDYVKKTSRLLKPESSGARESLISDMKKVFVISKCKCFVDVQSREEIVRANCNCKPSDQIINLSGFADQMFHLQEIIIFEEEKAIFEEKMAINDRLKSSPAKIHPGKSANTDQYKVHHPETARARPVPGSYANLEDSGLDMEDMDIGESTKSKYKYEKLHNTIGNLILL